MNEFERALCYGFGGTFRLDLYDDDNKPTGLKFIGDVSAFSPTASADKVERKAHTRGDDGSPPYNSVIGTLENNRTLEFSATISSHPDETLAAWFFGKSVPVTQSAGAASPVSVTVSALDAWLPIGDSKFLSSVDVTDSSSSAIAAAEYSLAPRLGLIQFKSGGSVSVGDVVTVTPVLQALTSATQIEMMARKSMAGRMMIDMYNRVAGQTRDMLIDLRKVSLTPDGSFDMMAAEFVDTQFKISVEYDTTVNPATGQPYGYGTIMMGNHPREAANA